MITTLLVLAIVAGIIFNGFVGVCLLTLVQETRERQLGIRDEVRRATLGANAAHEVGQRILFFLSGEMCASTIPQNGWDGTTSVPVAGTDIGGMEEV